MVEQFGLDVVQALHAPRAGQRRGVGAPRHHAAERRRVHAAARQRRARSASRSGSTPRARSAEIDFTGTSAQLENNFNAPTAVCMAAVLYVFRTLVDDEIPLNAGCLKPLKVIIPEGSMLNPQPPASVVAGNVETSTCITNALYGALGVMAASQCTMNNFTFGNARHQYYETISGGSGAGLVFDAEGRAVGGFDGTSVVQTHMTNSRLTDPEVLEFRFPVRLDSFEIRAGSGGAGRWHGGDGGVRRVRFLEPMTASILSNGRHAGAFGVAGGAPGAPGINRVERADGSVERARPHRQRRDGSRRRVRDRDAGRRRLRRGLTRLRRCCSWQPARSQADTRTMTAIPRSRPRDACRLPRALHAGGRAVDPARPSAAPAARRRRRGRSSACRSRPSRCTRFSVVDIDGKRAVRIEADESYGNLVHAVKSTAPPAHLAWQLAHREASRERRPAREARRRHGGQGLRLLRPADGQRPLRRPPAAAPGPLEDQRPGADRDHLLRLGREARRSARRSTTRSRAGCATSSSSGHRPARQVGRREARRRRRLRQALLRRERPGRAADHRRRASAPMPTTRKAHSIAYVSGGRARALRRPACARGPAGARDSLARPERDRHRRRHAAVDVRAAPRSCRSRAARSRPRPRSRSLFTSLRPMIVPSGATRTSTVASGLPTTAAVRTMFGLMRALMRPA